MASVTNATIERRRILIQGIVQGVGFRPFVYGQALGRALVGFVRNDSAGVTIEIEGPADILDDFLRALYNDLPPLARVDAITVETIPPCHDIAFAITHSHTEATRHALIAPDTVTCDDCLRELFDPADRRYGYPFINCTNCGPRFTIVRDVPYDRDKTTMRVFSLCAACQAEYDNPLNRRFHAQPNACPVCGPHVSLIDFTSSLPEGYENENPVTAAARALANGAILTIKGLGGYHLACDALNSEAVQRLRQRKHREAKPLALMVADMETARQLCFISEAEEALLRSRQRPVVLLQRHADCPVAAAVAPVHNTLGIMLAYTPLHHLLLRAFADCVKASAPDSFGCPAVLVMTSGNVSDEPIVYRDDDARERLFSIADAMLTHNREIHMRCDDSVTRIVAGGQQFFRRSRGYVPEPVSLAFQLPASALACGSHLKNTFCLGKERQAFVGHHIGDLENLETLTSFREGIEHFQRLFDISPEIIAYDLHPEYLATKYALDADIPRKVGVQHHHAHIASVMAEHGLTGPVIGVAADGTGYGTDGAVWGGEVMVADFTGFERLAHLAYMPLPGGEQAIRQPWRMAAAYLAETYGDDFLNVSIPFTQQLDRAKWHVLRQMIAKGINCPSTSSMGRLFDAVAALLGVCGEVLYEGQAAIELEILANQATNSEEVCYPFAIEGQLLDVKPTIRAVVNDIQRGVPTAQLALCFHSTIAELLATACVKARQQTGLHIVALSGGVFQNRLLLERLIARLETMAFQVYINRRVPPNDGGISLGQLAIAATLVRNGKMP